MNNFVLMVLDGLGIGELPDADIYNDTGSNTLANIADAVGGLNLPNLENLGLGNIGRFKGLKTKKTPLASFGKMAEVSKGKDSTTGHWELAGIKLDYEFPLYPNGFPDDLINQFLHLTNLKGILGNKTASGTEIIKELGAEHVKTGFPIVYTSADSVFQIAAHEEIIPLERLYEICSIARDKVLIGEQNVGRVIARPFTGNSGSYKRTTNRKDFSVFPPSDTILDSLNIAGIDTVSIGKVNDLFNHRSIKIEISTKSNKDGIEHTAGVLKNVANTFLFVNLVDFDVYYGHRNDPAGFYEALQEFDASLPAILNCLDNTDALIITADHGNDPTTPGTDHSREYVPLLFYKKTEKGKDLGLRTTFADVAQTAAHYYRVNNTLKGKSFLYG